MDYLNSSEKEFEKLCPFCQSDKIGTLSPKTIKPYPEYYVYCISCYAHTENFRSIRLAWEAWQKGFIKEHEFVRAIKRKLA